MSQIIKQGHIHFQSEARLLQELGERLVASPEVALIELIKNSYDADASKCTIAAPNAHTLSITDDGLGMTYSDFEGKWMRIATGSKQIDRLSKKYRRKMTGAKGIGRFAARFLGKELHLESVAYDPTEKCKTKIVADFCWKDFDSEQDVNKVEVPYKLFRVSESTQEGTTLVIGQVYKSLGDFISKRINTEILRIISPLKGLERGKFTQKESLKNDDPGFTVFNATEALDGSGDISVNILSAFWAKLLITAESDAVKYEIYFPGRSTPTVSRHVQFKNAIRSGLFADIRFFPKRAGVFQQKQFDGREAWGWISDNSGVAVVDHGFRVKPYGYPEDDWLKLSQDAAKNTRDWRTSIAQKEFPIKSEIKGSEILNPMLNLPKNHQLVGAVFVESGHLTSSEAVALIPSTDREGFLENAAYTNLVEIVRAGIELLAVTDKLELEKIARIEAQKAAKEARENIHSAINFIRKSPTLTAPDKSRLITEYTSLAKHIDEVDEYHRKSRQSLEVMSLLGVVAGFMTHESHRMIRGLEDAIAIIRDLAKKDKRLETHLKTLVDAHKEFSGHLEYTSMFIEATHNAKPMSFKVYPQIDRITKKFGAFCRERDIKPSIDVNKDLETPPLGVAVYSGIVLNLYTNAIKAIVAKDAGKDSNRILFKSWNEKGKHVLEVSDTGTGIPIEIEKRIWDPLFTTTSSLHNPLGTGMGLGLSLIKKLVEDLGGTIRITKPPSGFSTCFHLELPIRKQGKS